MPQCLYCSKEHGNKKFCSNSCRASYNIRQKNPMSDPAVVEKVSDYHRGLSRSEETKSRISKAHKGRKVTWGDKLSESLRGRVVPQETRDKLSRAHTGKVFTAQHRANIAAVRTIDGRTTYRYRALKHYGERCFECGAEGEDVKFDVHHVDGIQEDHSLDNLVVLCTKCHHTVAHKHLGRKGGIVLDEEFRLKVLKERGLI